MFTKIFAVETGAKMCTKKTKQQKSLNFILCPVHFFNLAT